MEGKFIFSPSDSSRRLWKINKKIPRILAYDLNKKDILKANPCQGLHQLFVNRGLVTRCVHNDNNDNYRLCKCKWEKHILSCEAHFPPLVVQALFSEKYPRTSLKLISFSTVHTKVKCQTFRRLESVCVLTDGFFFGKAFSRLLCAFVHSSCAWVVHSSPCLCGSRRIVLGKRSLTKKKKYLFRQTNQRRIKL